MNDLELIVYVAAGTTAITAAGAAVLYASADSLGLRNGRAALKVGWNMLTKVPIQDFYRWIVSAPEEDRRLSEKYQGLFQPYLKTP